MAKEKFFGGLDAAEYAVTLTDEWKLDIDEICGAKRLCEWMDFLDGEAPLDEEEDTVYYLVDENGAIGLVDEDADTICWIAVPTRPRFDLSRAGIQPQPQTCPGCGSQVESDWSFCQKCGYKLR